MDEAALEYETHARNIDEGFALVIDAATWASGFSPALARALPFIAMWLKYQAHKLKVGLADGTIVPDGAGGFVPITNSRYDPKTGEFL